jgi:hypothetical protein
VIIRFARKDANGIIKVVLLDVMLLFVEIMLVNPTKLSKAVLKTVRNLHLEATAATLSATKEKLNNPALRIALALLQYLNPRVFAETIFATLTKTFLIAHTIAAEVLDLALGKQKHVIIQPAQMDASGVIKDVQLDVLLEFPMRQSVETIYVLLAKKMFTLAHPIVLEVL